MCTLVASVEKICKEMAINDHKLTYLDLQRRVDNSTGTLYMDNALPTFNKKFCTYFVIANLTFFWRSVECSYTKINVLVHLPSHLEAHYFV